MPRGGLVTLAEYNAKRKALTRLERVGWLNYRLNVLQALSGLPPDTRRTIRFQQNQGNYFWSSPAAEVVASDIRAYRRKHKFWECR